MSRTAKIVTVTVSAASVALLLATFTAFAQERGGGMMMRGQQQMSKPMMMRTRMLMSMHVNPLDPNAVLALKDQLNLTDDQAQQIRDIAGQAREKVRSVLNSEQKSELEKVEKTPNSSMAMHRMMGSMRGEMGQGMQGGQMGHGMHDPGANVSSNGCPMMQAMKNMQGQ